jgi:hypothetical protein
MTAGLWALMAGRLWGTFLHTPYLFVVLLPNSTHFLLPILVEELRMVNILCSVWFIRGAVCSYGFYGSWKLLLWQAAGSCFYGRQLGVALMAGSWELLLWQAAGSCFDGRQLGASFMAAGSCDLVFSLCSTSLQQKASRFLRALLIPHN